MLDDNLKQQLKAYLQKLQQPIELVASLDDSAKSGEMRTLLEQIDGLSELIRLRDDGTDERRPSFAINREGDDTGVVFAGPPMGHEFTSLVLALLQAGGHPPRVSDEVLDQVRAIDGEFVFETYYSQSCQNCPEVVQALNLMAIFNPGIRHVAIDGSVFREEVEQREVMSVPAVYCNGEFFDQGRMTLEQVLGRIDTGAAQREVANLDARESFDVLTVGGGPAGAAAAIYAARKGIRTGVVAERFGGQVADTMGIENFISVTETEGPKMVAAMEQHVHQYEVDVMDSQRVVRLNPAAEEGGEHEVELASGARLRSRTLVLSPGARWRNINVPGEKEYANRGVAYCPHCDGPFYKGRDVAVIGGGNSGVEAAIDLAGIVSQVFVIELQDSLQADAVLVKKLQSLPNVEVITGAKTTEINGDGSKVTGLTFEETNSGAARTVDVAGVFVQIGLVPNTEWLRDSAVELSPYGEIVTDAHGMTSVPGVFAAGDATTVPYKQIVIAMGEGATAALGAFDYLIRH